MPNLSPRVYLLVAVSVLAIVCGTGSAAADSPVILGDVGGNSTDAGSSCTAFGFASSASHPYSIPYDGVISKFALTAGDGYTAGELARPRTVHATSATSGYVASEGTAMSLGPPLPSAAVGAFNTRFSASAGDDLAITTTTSGPTVGNTHCTSLATGDPAADSGVRAGSAPTGVPLSDWTDTAARLPNIRAMLEPDADQDGYGDGSQDLCPGNAAYHSTACSGALFGVNTSLATAAGTFQCAFSCVRVQTAIDGISTAAPYKGVVVRWRAASQAATTMNIRILKPTDATHFQIMRSSDPAAIAASPQPSSGGTFPPSMITVPARVPIDQGDFVGLGMDTAAAPFYSDEIPGSTYYDLASSPDGSVVGTPGALTRMNFYNADIERDADGDGYGDQTQDLCPTDATRQTECPSTDDTTAPAISRLSVSPSRFRVSTKGAVITKSVPKGTKFKLTLSERSTVTLSVYRIVKKKSRMVHSFTRPGKPGANSFAYSGRYRPAFKTKRLSAGRYKLKVIANDAAGNTSPLSSAGFTVAR